MEDNVNEEITVDEKKENEVVVEKKSNIIVRLIFYFLGLFLVTAGVALSVKTKLGVSPVSSFPYTMTCVWGLEMGKATIILHVSLVLIQIILLRKKFKIKNLLQVLVAIIFGYFTTFCNWGVSQMFPGQVENIVIRLLMLIFSILLIALGLFFYIPADIIPLPYEGLTITISNMTNQPVHRIKIYVDVIIVTVSLVTCLICIHSLGSVGLGTVVAAVFVGIVLGFYNKILGNWRKKLY